MEDEAVALREMQAKVEKEMGSSQGYCLSFLLPVPFLSNSSLGTFYFSKIHNARKRTGIGWWIAHYCILKFLSYVFLNFYISFSFRLLYMFWCLFLKPNCCYLVELISLLLYVCIYIYCRQRLGLYLAYFVAVNLKNVQENIKCGEMSTQLYLIS